MLLTVKSKRKMFFYVTAVIGLAIFITLITYHSHFPFSRISQSKFKKAAIKYLEKVASKMQVKEKNCSEFFTRSINKTAIHESDIKNIGNPLSDESYLHLTRDCHKFQKSRGYIMSSLTKEEANFPLAFSLVIYKHTEMVERLFRAIYRPQNYYCIHVDMKSSDIFYRAISSIVQCFPNAFLTSTRLDVEWGKLSVLETELLCMKELWRYTRWKYFINLTGQEFPLKTNYELVKILTAYRGANDVSTTVKKAEKQRWRDTVPPFGLLAVKSSVHIVVNRYFVDFILHNETAEAILNWTKTVHFPDEVFFGILNANPQLGIKGTYTGKPEKSATRPFLARFKNWKWFPCAGRFVRGVCILSTGDLPLLGKARELFANKFFLEKDRLVIGCLEEKLFNDTRDEYKGVKQFNVSFYANVDFVTNQIR